MGTEIFKKIYPDFFRNASLVSIRECKEKNSVPHRKEAHSMTTTRIQAKKGCDPP